MPIPTHSATSNGAGQNHREHSRHDEIINRVNPKRAQSVDLFGDFHRADFRRHRRAHPPGDHQPRHHRSQLAKHRHGDDRPDCRIHSQPVKLKIGLRREHRSGERSGDHDNKLRPEADFEQLFEKKPPANRGDKHRAASVNGKQNEFAHIAEERKSVASEIPDEGCHIGQTVAESCRNSASPNAQGTILSGCVLLFGFNSGGMEPTMRASRLSLRKMPRTS